MPQVGQITQTGDRQWSIAKTIGPARVVNVNTAATLNYIGIWAIEPTSRPPNSSNLRAAVYDSSNVLVAQSSILVNNVASNTVYNVQRLNFAGESIPAGNYTLVVVGSEEVATVCSGTNGSAGVITYMFTDTFDIYPNYPAVANNVATGEMKTDATRAWDIFLDYSEASGGNTITVSNVAGANVITSAQTFWIISGNNFSNANVQITQNNVTINQAINSQNTTRINCNTTFLSANDLKYGTATLRVVNGDGANANISITINTASGMSYVNLTTPDTNSSNRITATADLAANDQLEISNVTGGTIADVTVYSNATFNVASNITGFDVRVWDTSDQNWGSVNTQTIIITGMRTQFGFSSAKPTNQMLTTINGTRYSVPIVFHDGTILFEDDFSSGDLTKTVNGHQWLGGPSVSVISNFSHLGNSGNCVKLDFTGTWAELRYQFGSHLTEVYYRWYQYFPDGNESPTRGPRVARTAGGNNKLIRAWGGTDYDNTALPRYGSETFTTSPSGDEIANMEAALTEGSEAIGGIDGSTDVTPFLADANRGRWFKVEWRFKMNTSHSSPNGELDCWIDNVLKSSVRNLDSAFGAGTGFIAGYFWGSQNGAYLNSGTQIYMSKVAWGIGGRLGD